jgi:hypothetical protein
MRPKITFGVIVLNGEPFTRYCLRALYPFAHEIIVVEGASRHAAAIATPDGHSTDLTRETLREFAESEDLEKKVTIVTRDGFWQEKDEQSRAYADLATGDYLWQVDIDEFYRPDDLQAILNLLTARPEITAVSFRQLTFWGGLDFMVDGWYLRAGADICHRLFKWGAGYRYITHRPTTVCDASGRNLRELCWVRGDKATGRPVRLYHYSLLFPKQVRDKCAYYDAAPWVGRNGYREWAEQGYLTLTRPFRVHNVYDQPSWLERFTGRHPPQVEAMMSDIRSGLIQVVLRPTDDVVRLLASPLYGWKRALLRVAGGIIKFMARLQ